MRDSKLLVLIIVFFLARSLYAQGYGGPLTFQGLDRVVLHSAAARAMAGISFGAKSDIGVMFQHPASLYSLQKMQLSVAGARQSQRLQQEQQYAPVRYYPNLSLLLEGLTAQIPDPDTSLFGFSAKDTVQRPFDDIGPNWSRTKKRQQPIQALIAIPIAIGNLKFVAGMGVLSHADLNHYYQNNNVLSPSILSQRPLPTLRPTDDKPLQVDWFQSIRSRDGWIKGYGLALASGVEKYHLWFGVSGIVLKGTSDDLEQQIARGKLTFFSNAFRIDSVFHRTLKSGTSEFNGHELTISSQWVGRYATLGVSLRPATTISRAYRLTLQTESDAGFQFEAIVGKDKLKLPWRGAIGLMLAPRDNLSFGLEYEVRPYKSLRYIAPSGEEAKPWLPASLVRVGAEYFITPWMALRAGVRGEAEVFEPEGNQLPGTPVTYEVYCAGIGIFFDQFQLNLCYENSLMKYQDVWSSAISKNSERRQTWAMQLSYELPWRIGALNPQR